MVVAVCCSVLQCAVVCCSVLQCVAACYCVLRARSHIMVAITHSCVRHDALRSFLIYVCLTLISYYGVATVSRID